jgi:hypothetical protein
MAELNASGMPYLNQLVKHVEGLSPEDVYMIQQYTHHGDVIMNARLRGVDTIETYRENIYNPREHAGGSFFCLFLLDIASDALDYGPHLAKELVKDAGFMRYYTDSVYSKILIQLKAGNIDYFRELTDKAIQRIITILAKRPPTEDFITVYRGSSQKYLQELQLQGLVLGSFHSTSIYAEIADIFAPLTASGRVIYKFIVSEHCTYMYIDPISVHQGEFEVLIAPGNRYVCIPKGLVPGDSDSYVSFMILPLAAVGAAAAGGGAAGGAAAAGGGAAGGGGASAAATGGGAVVEMVNTLKEHIEVKKRRGGRRTRKRKSLKRTHRRGHKKTRKQRGGESIHLDPMSRWAVDPMFVRIDELSEEDLGLIAQTLVKMKEQSRKNRRNSIFQL